MATYIYFIGITCVCCFLAPVILGDVELPPVIHIQEVGIVEEASSEHFADYVKNNQYLLVLFYEENCPSCDDAKDLFDTLPEPDIFPGDIKKIKSSSEDLAKSYGANELPAFVLFRSGNPVVFDGEKLDAESVDTWLTVAHEVATRELTDGSFEHLTQASTGATTGDWLVAYFDEACSSILPIIESFGVRVKRKMNVAKVLMSTNPRLVKRMKATKCPSLIFYRQGKMYRYEVEKYDTESLTSFVVGWYKNMKGERIPIDPSSFDELTDNIAKALKEQIQGPNRITFLSIVLGIATVLAACIVLVCIMKRRSAEQKKKLF